MQKNQFGQAMPTRAHFLTIRTYTITRTQVGQYRDHSCEATCANSQVLSQREALYIRKLLCTNECGTLET